MSQAESLTLNGTTTGHIGYYYNNHRDTSDWYKVTTTADGMLKLIFDNSGNPDLITVSLFDTTGNPQLNTGTIGNGMGGLNTNSLAAGTYYIQITGHGDPNNFGPYTLTDSLISPIQANDIEPDNNISQAETLVENTTVTGHIGYYYNHQRDTSDWYKVITTTDGMLKLLIDNSGNPDLITIALFDTSGNPLLNTGNIGDGMGGFQNDGLAAGTYFIQITGHGDPNNFGPYTLTDSLLTYIYAADPEPDNFSYQADSLADNSTVTGHVSFYYNNQRDTTDWYKLNYTGNDGNLKFTVNILPELNDNTIHGIHFDIYRDTLSSPVSANSIAQASNTVTLNSLTTGNYYIKVYPINPATDWSAYSITNLFNNPLPVTFISFNGRLNNGEAILNWSTANEFNNKGFEVQKSMTGQTFATIGFVTGAGNSGNINTYNFTDDKVISGSNYYRLKQIDLDGRFTYSKIIKVLSNKKVSIIVSPNPAHNFININTSAPTTEVRLISESGSLLNSWINVTSTTKIDISNVPKGFYILKFVTANEIQSQKIIKE